MSWPTNPSSRAKLTTGHRKLGEVCEINPTKSEIKGVFDDSLVSFVPMSAVSETSQRIEEQEDKKLSEVKKGYTYFRKGDILFAKITPCMENGKVALSNNLEHEIGFASTEFHVIRAGEKILPKFVFHLVASKKFREEAQTRMTGSAGQKRVPKSFLETYAIPLPPLSEQKKIVARLERVLAKISEAKKLRAEARENADNLLPAELHKIFSTQQHPYKLENVGMSSVSKNGWEEKELGEVFVLNYGKGLSRLERSEDGKYIVYGANGELGRSDKYLIEGDGIIIGRKGSAGEITRVSGKYWPTDVTYFVTEGKNYAIGFTYYLFKFLNFPQYAVGVKPGINRNQIYEIKIPLPPIAEQKKIVARLDALSAKVQSLQQAQTKTASDFTALEQSFLHQAFNL